MLSISEKIEEIRQQPRHIRERYVWGCVAASMVLIVTIWFFSIAAMFKRDLPATQAGDMESLKQQLQSVNKQAPSLNDLEKQVTGTGGEGILNKEPSQENTDLQYPLPTQTNEVPQSSAYSTDN